MHIINNILIVPVNARADCNTCSSGRAEIFQQMENARVKGLILDVSAVKIMDSQVFRGLHKISGMASLMGAPTVFVGFRPGVASFLVETGEDVDNLLTAVSTQDAFEMIHGLLSPNGDQGPEEEQEEESMENEQTPEAPENGRTR